jgi:hypothetical protein
MRAEEAKTFVEAEILTRCTRELNAAQVKDWITAAMFVPDRETAEAIIRDIVQDPDARFEVKAFNRLALERRKKTRAVITDPTGFDPWVVCLEAPLDHPTWQGREWFVTDGFCRSDCGNAQYVREYAARMAREYQNRHGGNWAGIVKNLNNTHYIGPLSQAEVRQSAFGNILDGPESSGQRWLKKYLASKDMCLSTAMTNSLKDVPASPSEARDPGQEG